MIRVVGILTLVVGLSAGSGCAARVKPDQSTKSPDIRGTVTEVTGTTLRVTAVPGHSSRLDVALVEFASARIMRWADGTPAPSSVIRLGDEVSVWFRGPVRESYPVQGQADIVVIESTRR